MASDDAGALKPADPAQTRRRRQGDAHGQVGETDQPVFLKDGEDFPVDDVKRLTGLEFCAMICSLGRFRCINLPISCRQ
jgi:hypothetical protein